MRRREFISLVGAMTAALPLVTLAHQAGMNRSGVLMSAAQSDPEETFSDGYRKGKHTCLVVARELLARKSLSDETYTAAEKTMGLESLVALVVSIGSFS